MQTVTESTLDFSSVKEAAIAVKKLEEAASNKQYSSFLPHCRTLATNVISVVKLLSKLGWFPLAAEVKTRIREVLCKARQCLTEQTDANVQSFVEIIKNSAVVLIEVVRQLKALEDEQQ
jgi:fumarate reductase subunit C